MTNPNTINQALKQLTYGFYIVATRKDGDELTTRKNDWVSAGTVSWATQSSFDPAMITIAIQRESNLHETIGRSKAFSLTILGQQDEALIKKFAENSNVDYSNNQVNGVSYTEGKSGAPLLDCGVASIECELAEMLNPEHGDHILFVGKVIDAKQRNDDQAITEANTRFEYAGTHN